MRHIAVALETVVGFFFEQPGNNRRAELAAGGARLRVVRPDTRKMLIDLARGNVRWKLLSPDFQRPMEVVQMTLEPGASVGEEEWLVHVGQECGIVLSGALVIEFEHESFALAHGDSLYFPSTRPHRIRNSSDGPTTAIWIITPPSF